MQARTKKEFTDWTSGSCPGVRDWSCFIYSWQNLSPFNHCPLFSLSISTNTPWPVRQWPSLSLIWGNDTHSPHRAPCLWVHLFTILARITIALSPLPHSGHVSLFTITNDHIGPLSPHPGHTDVTVSPMPGLSLRPPEFPWVWIMSTFQIIFSSPFPVWPGPDWLTEHPLPLHQGWAPLCACAAALCSATLWSWIR